MKPNRFRFRTPSLFCVHLRYGAPVFAGMFITFTGLHADAGDILRGGGGAAANPVTGGTATTGGAATPAATNAARANARDTLARTTRTLDAMKAVQAAARASAVAGPNHLGTVSAPLPTVPNGIGIGGLNPAAIGTDPANPQKNVWTGAELLPANPADTTKVTIKQTTQQALLYWDTFNVGKETTLTFDQKAGGQNVGQWIAFNKVNDISANPTQILGNIKADGQIYIINRNGIIFGGSSQVNARGLTVSSLPINDNLINRGLLNNPDAQFLFSGLSIPAGLNGTPAFSPDAPLSADGKYGDVVVQQGAILESPTNSSKVGGRITLVGPNVSNRGTILTPDGQTILAAGLQVGFDGHSSSDPSLRGLDVFVGAVTDPLAGLYSGTTTQDGMIEAKRGSITIAGREIFQNGGLASTTSVSLNGRIDIQASYGAVPNTDSRTTAANRFVFRESGTVRLGEDSLIAITPESGSKETTVGGELALRSMLNVTGRNIHMGENSLVCASNAKVRIAAGEWVRIGSNPVPELAQSAGQVFLDHGAVIDVKGSIEVPVPVSQNILSIQLRGAELANSPLQREGPLRNATVSVDIRDEGVFKQEMWLGTPLADISGFANLIQRGVGQLTTSGGSVDISAGDSFVMRQGAEINVSGGSVHFQGGVVQTSQLVLATGGLVDIADARPDESYKGIYDGMTVEANTKWGVENYYAQPLAPDGRRYEGESVQGAAGGSISIAAASMALDGKLTGEVTKGDHQRETPPAASSLALSFTSKDRSFTIPLVHAPTPPNITFRAGVTQVEAGDFQIDPAGNPADLPQDRIDNVYLSPELLAGDGFGTISIYNPDGEITLPEDVSLIAQALGSITLTGSNIAVLGSIVAPGGQITLRSPNLSLDTLNNNPGVLPLPTPGRGVFTLGSGGIVSVAGLIVDDRISSPTAGKTSLVTAGGSVVIDAYSSTLSTGGLIDVSGGAYLPARGNVSYGNGGSLNVANGSDDTTAGTLLGGKLLLGATLQGYSGAKGGSLALNATAFQIGGTTSHADVTVLNPEFFSSGGFTSFSLVGIGIADSSGGYIPGVRIAAGTVIHPVAQGWLASVRDSSDFSLTTVLREQGARTPVNLSFSASGAFSATAARGFVLRGDIVMEEGSLIHTDALASVSFTGQTVSLHGTVEVPAGSITVAGSNTFPSGSEPLSATATTLIGSTASLSAVGTTVLTENPLGLRQGNVYRGGAISVTGNLIAEAGALLDVSGTSGVLDLAPGYSSLNPDAVAAVRGRDYVPVTIETNGGSISLGGSQMLHSDATLIGNAGGISAIGGSLTIGSGRFVVAGGSSTSADTNLVVKQSGPTIPAGSPGIGEVLFDTDGNVLPGIGNFAVDSYATGGFNSLTLSGNVRIEGDVTIRTPGRLRIASGGVMTATGNVVLNAGQIALGQDFRPPLLTGQTINRFTQSGPSVVDPAYTFAPVYGSGKLTVNAGLIDLGDVSLQSIGNANFIATNGDIRGNGTLSAAGDLTFEAGQIYPTTGSEFSIFAYNHDGGNGSVTIRGGTTRSLPFSAGGTLSVYTSTITQDGTLRAPVGTINLGWNGVGTAPVDPIAGTKIARPVSSQITLASGSLTSVSAIDPITGKVAILPYGVSLDGDSWLDPAGNNITVSGLTTKKVGLSGETVTSEAGSIIDIKGSGDLYAYRWIEGNGGRNDVLDTAGSFAVIPGYGFGYAPYAAFGTSSTLGGDTGYANTTLRAGDQVTLSASPGLAAGTYTLLPARYALFPGAFLITPGSGTPVGTVKRPDGSSIVSGYRANNLDPARTGQTSITNFEVASSKVVRARSEYQDLLANTTLREAAIARNFAVPRLPVDAGYLSFTASTGMSLGGLVNSSAPEGGRGGVVDINSPVDILINGTGTGGLPNTLVLGSSLLNSFGAESLLIGGIRTFTSEGVTVTTGTGNLTVNNGGSALVGSDIILVARENLTLEDGAEIAASGDAATDDLLLGDPASAGSGNGTLVRVSGSDSAAVTRRGTSSTTTLANLAVGSNASLTGGSVSLDSTYATFLDPAASLDADTVFLSSGRISLELDNPGTIDPANAGLVLSGQVLTDLQRSANKLSLLSYSTLDVYGTGTVGSRNLEQLSLQAASLRGFNTLGGTVTYSATRVTLGNRADSDAPAPLISPLSGSATFDADQITLGGHAIQLDGYAKVRLAATASILIENQGSLAVVGNLDVITPRLTGASASKYEIRSAGALDFSQPDVSRPSQFDGGFGADLSLQGASVRVNSDIILPSGKITLHATSGDLTLGDASTTTLDLAGTSTRFIDTIRYTSGGTVKLISDAGSVNIQAAATINVSAKEGGGNAGFIQVKAPSGNLDLAGTIIGTAGEPNEKGKVSLDVGAIPGGSLAATDAILNAGSFTQSRDYRIRNGNVIIDGLATSQTYRVAADSGSITVSNTIDASGITGGIIDLKANGSLTLGSGSLLNASGTRFDSAGKGGSVTLEAGNQRNGVVQASANLDLVTGSSINLSVAEANASSQSLGKFTGTLHLRAPRGSTNSDLQINSIGSSISGASSILVEGYKIYELTGTGTITTAVQNQILNDGNSFLGASGSASPSYTAMLSRLTSLNPSLDLILAPGAEIINQHGDLTLGTTTSTATSDWNLSTFRFGPRGAAGVLTMRATGNLTFFNALSDGFSGGASLWLSPLNTYNPLLPANTQSWSLRLSAGANLAAASFREVMDLSELGAASGSLLLGKDRGGATATGGANATTASIIGNAFQIIRTGSGDIDINVGRSIRLLNVFSSIYTAGTQLADPTKVITSGDFVTPSLANIPGLSQGDLGTPQQQYTAQYSMAGGNLTLRAGVDIERKTRNNSGLIDDSSRQIPNNWLYRRGYIGPDGEYGEVDLKRTGLSVFNDPAASTSWWVDFSNFFQSVGTLGGGNVSLDAGNNVSNVDAVAPTNARAAIGRPSTESLVELGGGDVRVHAGNDISGGIYYVERGKGTLEAGGSITTNATRSPSPGIVSNLNNPVYTDSRAWIPTLLFAGKSRFDVSARGDLLIGPTYNPFLLPTGLNNRFWYKSYFSTFSPDTSTKLTSLGGDITLRNAITFGNSNAPVSVLQGWLSTQNVLANSNASAARSQPWLRLGETSVTAFQPVLSLTAPTLMLSALSGNINLAGSLNLFPSATGQLELVATGGISALQPTGLSTGIIAGRSTVVWSASTLNLSDANPASVPGSVSPLGYFGIVGDERAANVTTSATFLDPLSVLFVESGSFVGQNATIQTKQGRHTPGLLHRDDKEPARLYSLGGDLSGLTLFTPKSARVFASRDITDVAFYLQNLLVGDISIVSAGRDLIAYNTSSQTRALALSTGNAVAIGQTALAGDVQISGPGTLQVLAGHNLDLGIGGSNNDGTGTGITSIGNFRNPYLPEQGADLLVGAGIGPASSLAAGNINFESFITQFASSPDGNRYLAEAMGILGVLTDYEGTGTLESGIQIQSVTADGAADVAGLKSGDVILKVADREITPGYDDSYLLSGIPLGDATKVQILRDGVPLELDIMPGSDLLNLADPALTQEQQQQMALAIFNLVLRDTGRDFNDPDSAGYRIYDKGFDAIKALFPESVAWSGEILTQSRDIRTRSGGGISIFVPGGGLAMADTSLGNSLTPPGIVTESGGSISVFTDQNVGIGIGRIFTLKGGNVGIWSSNGDIAAGSSSRTVSAAPPTRVIIDPQSASVETDLAGLATGGGIGVLASVEGVAPGNVDLIAPTGVIDAGDAGIRVSGNINLAAVTVVNAGNISAGGSSAGAPAAASAPSISTVTSASNSSAAAGSTVEKAGEEQNSVKTQDASEEVASLYTVEVIGYGGGGNPDDDEDEDEEEKAR
jgi:filamentous hemagglutinin